MDIIHAKKENVLSEYEKAGDVVRDVLQRLFGKKFFKLSIVERIKSFEDACEEEGIDPASFDFSKMTIDEIAYVKLKVIIKALNEDWIADYNNRNQRKWGVWFYLDNPGFRFDDASYVIAYTSTAGGSRLCFATEELAVYAAKQFIDLYKDYLS